jgi:large subunit ribosomal protein L22
MTGPKLNEGALLIPEDQPYTKATAKYLRGSAYKAREVLDLIRGVDVRRADEILQFTTRDAARDVRKVLASAVANAVHNDAQDADELFVLAAFADEGPTLKRFRPRARGRASRIRKRTSHITIVVARLSDARLEVVQARQQASSPTARRRAGTTAQSRAERVQRSRTRAESLRDGDTTAEDTVTDVDATEAEAIETDATEIQSFADLADAADTATTEVETAEVETAEAETTDADDSAEADAPTIDLPAGAVAAPADGSTPSGYEIKGNASSKKFHVPGGRYYDITIAELFFDTVESAEAAGYEAPAADADLVEGEEA